MESKEFFYFTFASINSNSIFVCVKTKKNEAKTIPKIPSELHVFFPLNFSLFSFFCLKICNNVFIFHTDLSVPLFGNSVITWKFHLIDWFDWRSPQEWWWRKPCRYVSDSASRWFDKFRCDSNSMFIILLRFFTLSLFLSRIDPMQHFPNWNVGACHCELCFQMAEKGQKLLID